jgi:sugar lactone lactonase YvrE
MNTTCLSLVATLTLATIPAHSQFLNFPAADRVLGASDFTTAGTGALTASAINSPRGLAIDPTSGKLFVVCRSLSRILRFPDTANIVNGMNAEAVLGQNDFTSSSQGCTSQKLGFPGGISVDSSGRLWVADSDNHRVLMFESASSASNGAEADLVLGQPDFVTHTPGTSAAKMNTPFSVCVDGADNLWVADSQNNRVLRFAAVSGVANGAAATSVIGQADFITATEGTSGSKMTFPYAVTVDGGGRLWVAEYGNHRVLRFDNAATLGNGAVATGVLGQPTLNSGTSGTTAQSMMFPSALSIDSFGTLFVSDSSNSRILLFKSAATKADGAAADGVIGQPDFITATADTTERKLRGPFVGLASDGNGHLWVADEGNNRTLRFPVNTSASVLDANMTASLVDDVNGNTQADAGDEILYLLTIRNPEDPGNVAATGSRFSLTPPTDTVLKVGSVISTQGTVMVGNSIGDTRIEIDLGTISDAGTVTILFILTLDYEAQSPLFVQGTIEADLLSDLLTDDPSVSGFEDPTAFAVTYTYRPATFNLGKLSATKAISIRLFGTATNTIYVEVKRKPSGPIRRFYVVGTRFSGNLSGLKVGPNDFNVRALGKDGKFTPSRTISVRRLGVRNYRR